jgi:NodT family efflux transporter outer membrane factor (OMF) lipoprotein
LAPPEKLPDIPLAASYKEAAPWTTAEPADALKRDAWWTVYRDDDLDALQVRLIANSPDLEAAFARYRQATAITDQARAGLFPALIGSVNLQRDRQAIDRPLRVLGPGSPNDYGSYTVNLEVDYELDLWGRIRNQVASGVASEEAAARDLESARLSLEAQLADSYLALRGLDRQIALLVDTADAYGKALDLTTTRHDGGLASGLDVARAQTQLESTRAQLKQTIAQRAVNEHAIAALIGDSASNFSLPPRLANIPLPAIPIDVPSVLLQRRPDIAAAERRIAAANAGIGVARAAQYPSITLSGLIGYQSDDINHLISAPNTFWAIGPSLLAPLFDAGRRRAEVDRTRAVLDEQGARYRSVVLGAFQQVEDNLALLNHYRDAAVSERAAVDAAQRSLDFASLRYREGAVNYLEVVIAQTALLQTQQTSLGLDTAQQRASVQLIRALGGGWSAASPPLAGNGE